MDCRREGCLNKALDWKACAQCFIEKYCSDECLTEDWQQKHEDLCPPHLFSLQDLMPNNQIIQKLGKVSYSEVALVRQKGTHEFYALKIIKKSILSVRLPIEALFREISLHKSLVHENIIRLYDQLEDSSHIYLVLEYAGKTNLFEYTKMKLSLDELEAAKIFVEICLGVKFMHERNILHRDLKSENILITDDNTIKICDLGWSSYCESYRRTVCGTVDYMSPEILEGQNYSFPSDVWSLGVLLYEILHGRTPFGRDNSGSKIEKMRKEEFEIDSKLSPAAKGLIKKLLRYDPEKRATLKEIFEHRWIQENYKTEISVGSRINHNDFGIGIVGFIKGLTCTVDFTNISLEFIVPELLKVSDILNETEFSDLGIRTLATIIGKNVSPIPTDRSHSAVRKWKLQESYSGLIDNSTIAEDLTRTCEENERTIERQKELAQLQDKLENPIRKPAFTPIVSSSIVDSVISRVSCLKRY